MEYRKKQRNGTEIRNYMPSVIISAEFMKRNRDKKKRHPIRKYCFLFNPQLATTILSRHEAEQLRKVWSGEGRQAGETLAHKVCEWLVGWSR